MDKSEEDLPENNRNDTQDPDKPQLITVRYGMHTIAYRGEYWPKFWPRSLVDKSYTDSTDWHDWYESWQRFEARPDDVIISSYPKSGHHWMFDVVHMIVNGTTTSRNENKGRNFVEERTMEELDQLPEPRILLTHVKYNQMPKSIFAKGCKILYMYRNPKDVAVSYMHHMKNMFPFYNLSCNWSQYFDLVMDGEHEYGRWLDNVPQWWQNGKHNQNILFLRYEQMKKNFIPNAQKLATFLGKSYDNDFFERLSKACSFETMQNNPTLDASPRIRTDDTVKHVMFRKGEVGDWKNYFTVSQSEQFDRAYNAVMSHHKDLEVEFE